MKKPPRIEIITIGDEVLPGDALDTNMEREVVRLLTEKNRTCAVAESCTGGLIANRITNVSGASKVFLGGIVSYANEVKERVLGVPAEVLREHGAVSEACAIAMVRGVQKITGANYAAAVTGVAGPTGGTPDKPVGTVYIATLCDGEESCEKHLFQFTRDMFKQMCAAVVFKNFMERLR